MIKRIQLWHVGQLVIVWILLLLSIPAFGVGAFLADASVDRGAQLEVDRAKRPAIVIDGIRLSADSSELSLFERYLRQTDQFNAYPPVDEQYREYVARQALLKRGVDRSSADARAHAMASTIYYDSSRAYYDGIRESYRRNRGLTVVVSRLLGALALLAPFVGLLLTWVWFGGRNRRAPDAAV